MAFISTVEMRAKRHEYMEKCRGITSQYERSKKPLNDADKARWEEAFGAAEKLTSEIRSTELLNDEEANRLAAKNDAAEFGVAYRDDRGNEVRAIRHGQSFARALGIQQSRGSIGNVIMAHITGDHRPLNEEERSVYAQGTSASGGYLVPSEMSASVIDKARAMSVMSQAGITTLPMQTETLRVARIETDPTAYWTAENAEITESEGTFGSFELRSRALAIYCLASIEVLRNASNAQAIIEDTIAKSMALALDASMLNGPASGGQEPTGLLNSSQVTSSAVGGAFTYDKLLAAMALCWAGNSEPNVWIMDDHLRKYCALLKDGDGMWLAPPPEAANVTRLMTTQLSSADSNGTCYVGDFSNYLLGIRSQIEIEASGVAGTTFQKKQVAIRGLMFCDFGVARSGDIVKMTGITGLT